MALAAPWVSQVVMTQWGRLEPTAGGYSRLLGLVPVPTPSDLHSHPAHRPAALCWLWCSPIPPRLPPAPLAGVERAGAGFPGGTGLSFMLHPGSSPKLYLSGRGGNRQELRGGFCPLPPLRAQHTLQGSLAGSTSLRPFI